MNEVKHVCNRYCVCPIHETPLWYASLTNEHACLDINCDYAQGVEKRMIYAYRNSIFSNLFKQCGTN